MANYVIGSDIYSFWGRVYKTIKNRQSLGVKRGSLIAPIDNQWRYAG